MSTDDTLEVREFVLQRCHTFPLRGRLNRQVLRDKQILNEFWGLVFLKKWPVIPLMFCDHLIFYAYVHTQTWSEYLLRWLGRESEDTPYEILPFIQINYCCMSFKPLI